jgi:ATP-binding cassette, subfamily B, multidrug efflux pump
VKPYKRFLYLAIFLGILLAIITPLRPYLINLTVNTVTHSSTPVATFLQHILFLPAHFTLAQFIIAISILQVVLLLIETSMRFAFSFLTSWLGQYVINDLRKAVFSKVLGLNLSQFDKTPIGTLTTVLSTISKVSTMFSAMVSFPSLPICSPSSVPYR